MTEKPNTQDILRKYSAKLEGQINNFDSSTSPDSYSKSYQNFKSSLTPIYSTYEKWCKSLGNIFRIKPSQKDSEKIQKFIDVAHLNITPAEALGFSLILFLISFLGGLLLIVSFWLLFSDGSISSFPFLLFMLTLIFSVVIYFYSSSYPQRLSVLWRLKASSQMVPAILYIVIYMKHTSNLEKAISFASQHLDDPLASDFKKIFWDVEVGRFSTVKESLDSYLESWRGYSLEFIEAFHLIESSLYEPSESRRVAFLEKSMQVILDGVYDKMLKYSHNVRSPLTNLYMLGIVLPTLSLAILPLASTMLGEGIKWYHVFVLFNLLIPFGVIYLTGKIILERPGGHGEASLLEKNPMYPKYASKKPYWFSFFLALPLFLIGIFPLIWAYTPLSTWLGMKLDYTWAEIGMSFMGKSGIFGITKTAEGIVGPIGTLSLLLSLMIPVALGVFFVVANNMRSKELILEREKYKEVEAEFTSSLFQLGNRLGDGLPPEIAFSKVMESTRGTSTEGFFRLVNENIQQLGMSVENALFNSRRGAIIFYPSHLIETSMKILIESSKKGLQVAARSLMAISEYVKNIRKIDDRLNDLLAEIISDMKSNMTFLAPLLSGIIVGLSGMITAILSNLMSSLNTGQLGEVGGFSGLSTLLNLFDVSKMIPPYWIQVSVSLYLVQIIFILTATLVTIKSGKDELQKTYQIGRNLKAGIILYVVVALIAILGLSLLSSVVVR